MIAVRGLRFKLKIGKKCRYFTIYPRILLLFFLVMVIVIMAFFNHKLTPIVSQLAVTALEGKISSCINSSVIEFLENENVDFDNIYKTVKDNNGEIKNISLNTIKANEIKESVTKKIITAVEKMDTSIFIPIGNLSNIALLNGKGYHIKIDMLTVTAVNNRIINKVENSGVNQTHLSSYIIVSVNASAVIGGKAVQANACSEILLCETVIVGKVPDSFVSVKALDKDTIHWLEQYRKN